MNADQIPSPDSTLCRIQTYVVLDCVVRRNVVIIIMDPPGVFIVFVTLLFFTITIHTATDKSADDVGNYYVELAET